MSDFTQALLALLAQLAQWLWLVPAGPLLVAVLLALRGLLPTNSGDAAERLPAALATGAALVTLALLVAIDAGALLGVVPTRQEYGNWLSIGTVSLSFSMIADLLSLPAATLIALITWIVLRFSVSYLHRERGFLRFFLAMSLFLGGMLLIVLAGNAVLCFVGWELVGFSSWLLIAYAWERPTATGNALFAFLSNRVGDAGFLFAIALAVWSLESVEFDDLSAPGRLEGVSARLLALGLVLAAAVKSAQLPFTAWIARALEGPTPSSAVFYGSLLVHAGVFLLCRVQGLLVQVPDLMVLLLVLGATTALYGGLCALVQNDVKSALIFATVTQVGIMFVCCGLGFFWLAAGHAALHAAWRAYQFLLAPSYMHLVQQPAPPVARWLARRNWLYTAALQRFWLEPLVDSLFTRPTLSLGQDMRAFDERVIDPFIGVPRDDQQAAVESGSSSPLVCGQGLPGSALFNFANRLQHFEDRLLFRGGGRLSKFFHAAGLYADAIEALLEQPRYLMLMVMATLAVIL